MEDIDKKIRKVKAIVGEVEEAKKLREQKIGEKNQLMKDLNTRFNLDSIEKAEKRILAIDQQINRRNKTVENEFEKLEKYYEF